MKKIVVISNFHEENDISRSQLAYKYFKKRGYFTEVLYSNYSHSLKKFRTFDNDDFKTIKTVSYQSSFSLSRILSYFIFAFKTFNYLRKKNPDIIYVNLPPNLLTFSVFFAKNKKTKVIVDILDLWPESLPIGGSSIKEFLKSSISYLFKPVREFAIKHSDYVISESSVFYHFLNLDRKKNSSVIHLKKIGTYAFDNEKLDKFMSIIYLGNIGNIYDFKSLIEILKGISKYKQVKLHIIGLGPNKLSLINDLQKESIDYEDHGASFDEKFKSSVISSCWFGYNGFKKGVEVGLSYKSIDYLSYNVPIINSLEEGTDTYNLIESERVGINFQSEKIDNLVDKIISLSKDDILRMKKNANRTFQDKFSEDSYYSEMDKVLESL